MKNPNEDVTLIFNRNQHEISRQMCATICSISVCSSIKFARQKGYMTRSFWGSQTVCLTTREKVHPIPSGYGLFKDCGLDNHNGTH